MSSATACLAVEVDERTKTFRFAADDCNHQRKSEHACAHKRFWSSAYADPNRQRILQRARIDRLPGEWRAMFAGPRNVRVLANCEEQSEFFGEKRIVIFELETEERIRFDE